MEGGSKEIDQLLNAIVEVSQSIARMPCPPEEKEDALVKVKVLFSCYNSIGSLLDRLKSASTKSKNSVDLTDTPTSVKESYAGAAAERHERFIGEQERILDLDKRLLTLEQKLYLSVETTQGSELSVASLKAEFATLDQVRNAQDSLCNRVSRIENKSNELEVFQDDLKKVSDVVEGRSYIGSMIAGLQDELLKIHREFADLESMVHNGPKTGPPNFVAFSASSASSLHKYKPGEIIQFPKVLVNFNDCYDSDEGVFKSKLLGLFVFTTSINTNCDGDFTAAIEHNDDEVALFGTPGKRDLQTGASVVLLLQPGDIVYIKVTTQSNRVGVEVGGGFSNFIGYKIA